MMSKFLKQQQGDVNPLLVVNIVLSVVILALGGFGAWAYMNYLDQKNHVDVKIANATTVAKQQQSDTDAKTFAEKEKQPTRPFAGPDDLGHVQFSFPKTWSVYVDKSGGDGGFEAYFQQDVVNSLSDSKAPYALRVSISNNTYDQVLSGYNDQVKTGALKSSPIVFDNGASGIRLDGTFSNSIKGSMVILKIRDKTLRIFSESQLFVPDFDNYILKTLKFNK